MVLSLKTWKSRSLPGLPRTEASSRSTSAKRKPRTNEAAAAALPRRLFAFAALAAAPRWLFFGSALSDSAPCGRSARRRRPLAKDHGEPRRKSRMLSFFRALGPALALAVLATVVDPAAAQEFPARPVTIVVGYTPGATSDLVARTIGERLNAAWGQSV